MGCKMPDTCHPSDSKILKLLPESISELKLTFFSVFCPVHCKAEEMHCGGQWDPKTGKQMTSDTCMPMKDGDCMNSCPVYCPDDAMICPGGSDAMGCKMPDFCYHGESCPDPTTGADNCKDNWPAKKCKKRKNKGKCNAKKVKKNCQKTCEFCGVAGGRFDDLFDFDEEDLD